MKMEMEATTKTTISSPLKQESSPDFELRHEFVRTTRGIDCMLHIWTSRKIKEGPVGEQNVKGVAVIYHGLGGHGLFATIRGLPEMLVTHESFVVYAMDQPGHGQSRGLRGYLESERAVMNDALMIAKRAVADYPKVPLYLGGNSMGGAIATLVSTQLPATAGVILVAPMLSLSVPAWQRWTLQQLNFLSPEMGLVKRSEKSTDYMIRDEERRLEVESDPYTYKGRMRIATALTCIRLSECVSEEMANVTAPILCLLANEDYVVDNTNVDGLMGVCGSKDKTLKHYDAYHSILCEPEPTRTQVEADLLSWMRGRQSGK